MPKKGNKKDKPVKEKPHETPDASGMEKEVFSDAREEDDNTDSLTVGGASQWEIFDSYFDIGLCVTICDARMTKLLEELLDQKIKSDDFANKLIAQLNSSDNTQLIPKKKERLKKLNFGHVKNLKLTISQLECALDLMTKEEMKDTKKMKEMHEVVDKLRKTRNEVVHTQFKFAHPSQKTKFLNDYKKFIELYFPTSSGNYQVKRKRYLEPVATSEEKARMVEEYKRKLKEEKKIYIDQNLEEINADLEAQIAQLNGEIDSLEKRETKHAEEKESIEKQLNAVQAELRAKETKASQLEKELSEQKKELEAIKDELDKKKEELSELERQLKEIESKLGECEQTVVKLREELRESQNNEEEYEKKVDQLKEEQVGLMEASLEVAGGPRQEMLRMGFEAMGGRVYLVSPIGEVMKRSEEFGKPMEELWEKKEAKKFAAERLQEGDNAVEVLCEALERMGVEGAGEWIRQERERAKRLAEEKGESSSDTREISTDEDDTEDADDQPTTSGAGL